MLVKKTFALIAALFVALLVICIGQILIHIAFPVVEEIDLTNIDWIKSAVASIPVTAMILAVLVHALGALAAGATLGRVLKEDTMNVGMTLGAILTALGMVSMVTFPHPEWFYVDLLAYMPPAILGANYTSKL